MGRRKINATYIVVKMVKTPSTGVITLSPLVLGSTFHERESHKTKHCRRYGVLADPGSKGLGTHFKSRRAAARAAQRTVDYAKAHDLGAWPTETELQVVGVNLDKEIKFAF